jgi:DNA primase
VAALQTALPMLHKALASSRRAQRYLDERGIPLSTALASSTGYFSRAVWEQLSEPAAQRRLKRWIGRILFPLHSPFGQGFIGRTLLRWEPGMDENTHKALLEQPGAPRRWIKTNPAGWFGADRLHHSDGPIILVEGGFDRLALLSAGIPAESVIALVGTAARPAWLRWLAPQVTHVVLALDADCSGEEAMARLAGEMWQAGLAVSLYPPPHDCWGKDWSERWRRLGPQSVWPLYEALAQHQSGQREGRR